MMRWELIRGREAILRRKDMLVALAKRCSQPSVLDFLEYFIAAPYFGLDVPLQALKLVPRQLLTQRARLPRLLLRSTGSEVDAAVFMFEYSLHGIRTRCFIPIDEDGYRSVIAPEVQRRNVALQAGQFLLEQGALIALASYMGNDAAISGQSTSAPEMLVGTQARQVRRKLPLQSGFEETLAGMSRNTRHNLRRAKRQVIDSYGASYSDCVELQIPELLELTATSKFAPPHWATRKRYELTMALENGFLASLRSSEGVLLSVLGGHREGDALCLDWQINRSGLGSVSVSTAMRAFLIEGEIAKGTAFIRFERGTTHPIQAAFVEETSHDLLFARHFLRSSFVRKLVEGSKGGLLPSILGSPALDWRV